MPEPVYLGHAEAGQIEPAAVVEVELLVLVQQRMRVDRAAEVETALRHAADHAGFGGQRQVVEHALLGGDRRDDLRHADAEVDDTAEATPSLDHRVGTHQQRLRDRQPERLCGLRVDRELELRGTLDRKICRPGTLENPIHVAGDSRLEVADVRTVREEHALLGKNFRALIDGMRNLTASSLMRCA